MKAVATLPTPGPWFTDVLGHVLDSNGVIVAHASLRVTNRRQDVGQMLANARLMAAAPATTAALRSLVAFLRSEERWPVRSEHMVYLQDAEKALAAAEADSK